MEVKSAGKVGAVLLASLILIGTLLFYLSHTNLDTYPVRITFDNTHGLAPQSVVRMQGVAVGEVKSITFDTHHIPIRPVVTVMIHREYAIPSDYLWSINSGLLINTAQVNISPPPNPVQVAALPMNGTATVMGQGQEDALSSFSPQLSHTLGNVNGSMKNLQDKLNGLTTQLHKLLGHTDEMVVTATGTLKSTRNVVGDPQVQANLKKTIANFLEVSQQAALTSRNLSGQLSGLVKDGRGQLTRLSSATTDLVLKLGNTLDDAQEVVKKLTQQVSDPRLQRSLQETLELARSTLASVRQITSDLHQITGDPAVAGGVKSTIINLKDATGKASSAMTKVNSLLDKLDGGAKHVSGIHGPKVTGSIDISQQINPGRLRVDLNGNVALNGLNSVDLGLYDIGQTNRLNLQLQHNLSKSADVRYGFHAGKLGLGADFYLAPGTLLTTDLFDTHEARLDLRAMFRVNNSTWFWLGGDNVFHHGVPLVGVQIRP
jgi:phospholipid/cholesterol/gamma-HCH transport system substrate-binding protein